MGYSFQFIFCNRLVSIFSIETKLNEKCVLKSTWCGIDVDYKLFAKQFFNHQAKSKSSIPFHTLALKLIGSKYIDVPGESKKLDKEPDLTNQLNEYKNNSLYVGIHNGKFKSPKKFITEKLATEIRKNAIIRYGSSSALTIQLFKGINELVLQYMKGEFDDK